MSNALAIAGVTAVLKDLLDSGVIEHKITDALGAGISVSSLPPDRVPIEGDGAAPRLNLFLYQVTPNAAWRNADLPERDARGGRLSNPPLALDLHYLLTAYGIDDLQAEVLLGYGMQLLHQHPVLSRAAIRTALAPSPVSAALLPSVYQALRSADLAEQVELLKITPQSMNAEELSGLWSALMAHYRPTATFQVSVVLIQPTGPAVSPLPVLTRGKPVPADPPGSIVREPGVAVGPGLVPPYPTLVAVSGKAHATPSTFELDEAVTVTGQHLAGAALTVLLEHERLKTPHEIKVGGNSDDGKFDFTVPASAAALSAGLYRLQLRIVRAGETEPRYSNTLPVALAPALTNFSSIAVTRSPANVLSLRVTCKPKVKQGQQVSLMLGTREGPARPFATDTATLDFDFPDAPPAGKPLLRLKVDGIESLVLNRGARPPVFLERRIELPA